MNIKLKLPGTTRSRTALETLQRILPLMRHYGITSMTYDTPFQTLPLPVYQCVRPHGKSITVTQGKGLTKELSQVSAIMEAIEFHQAENLPPTKIKASFQDLISKSMSAVDPNIMANYKHPRLHQISLEWLEGVCLSTNNKVLLPRAYFDMDFTRSYPENFFIKPISNGLASGNTWSESVVHGLLELVERYGMAQMKTMKLNDRLNHLVDVSTVKFSEQNEELNRLLQCVKSKGYNIIIESLTHALGVPTFHCEIQYKNLFGDHKIHPFRGAGSHFDREIALSRALTEAVQSAVTILSADKDNLGSTVVNRFEPGPLGYPHEARGVLDFAAIQNLPQGLSFDEDLTAFLAYLNQRGFESAYALDLSDQKNQIAVSFVYVPGMKYAWL
jgi:YcaO-like protein with predicted kinase domain